MRFQISGTPMTKLRKLALALLCASIVLSPALAEARAGGSARPGGSMGYSSQGSMGSRTFNNNGGQPPKAQHEEHQAPPPKDNSNKDNKDKNH